MAQMHLSPSNHGLRYGYPPIGRTRPSGFTLIEVLVVVAIIALLIAVLLPALAAARGHARTVVCASNEKQMVTGMTLFATEHKGRVPRGLSRHGSPDSSGPVNWVRMVARMFGDKNKYAENFNRVPVEKLEVFSCPQRSREYGGAFLDYAINSTDTRGPIDLANCKQDPGGGYWYEVEGVTKIEIWDRPGETIYMTEAVEESWNVVDSRNSRGTMQGIRENIAKTRQEIPPSNTGYDWFDVPGGRAMPTFKKYLSNEERKPRASLSMHQYVSNGGFVDGHVEIVKPPKPSTREWDVYAFYMRRFGVDPKIIPSVRAIDTTAALNPCTQGDTTWRPGQ